MYKLPPPRRLLRCELPHHDDSLVGRDLPVFDEIATLVDVELESNPLDALGLLLVIDELTISLTLIADPADPVESIDDRVAEVA